MNLIKKYEKLGGLTEKCGKTFQTANGFLNITELDNNKNNFTKESDLLSTKLIDGALTIDEYIKAFNSLIDSTYENIISSDKVTDVQREFAKGLLKNKINDGETKIKKIYLKYDYKSQFKIKMMLAGINKNKMNLKKN